jgi:CRP/FNR family transcriptional regulator, cyclic AMP receptor protein
MDLCETLFVLQRGKVRLYRATPEGREFTIAVAGSGTVFGEMALTGQRLRDSYAEALEESEVSAMCRADVERLILDRPRVGLQLIHLLSDRLATHETRMEDMALREVPARLARLLLLLVENDGIRTSAGYKIATRYTHQQLGTMIGANREAVTRAFARLREIGLVEVKRRYINVEDIEKLRAATEDDFSGSNRRPKQSHWTSWPRRRPETASAATNWKRTPSSFTARLTRSSRSLEPWMNSSARPRKRCRNPASTTTSDTARRRPLRATEP